MAYARNGDVEIFYETFGEPTHPALLLVNGLGSQCINYKDEWCEQFAAERFFVIRFDNRDVGLSTKFDQVSPDVAAVRRTLGDGGRPDVPYLVSDMAADACAVLDAVGVAAAHVAGFSMGGFIVQTLAIEHPERLLSMTSVMSSTGDPDVGQPSSEALEVFMRPPPTDRESYIARHIDGLRAWGSPAHLDEPRLRANADAAFDRCFCPDGQARQTMAIMASGSRTAALRDVQVPALVLHGDADHLVDPSGGRRTADSIPGARLVMIEGMGHDYPPAYWSELVRLITDHARTATADAGA